MQKALEILRYAYQTGFEPQLSVVHQKERQIPGSVHYKISRFIAQNEWNAEDVGLLVYNKNPETPSQNHIELRFCIIGNKFCYEKGCNECNGNPELCTGNQSTIDIFSFFYTSQFLHPYTTPEKSDEIVENVVSFHVESSFSKIFHLCNKKKDILYSILNNNFSGALENIFVNTKIQELLLVSLECLVEEEKIEGFSCKFLEDERSREAIYKAKDILLKRINNPITIKDLSRKVAMNECYVKKGFKEIFGTTIFEFYQHHRMEHAKYLLHEKGLNVSEVSDTLGYSSISHFSAAFKKHTGMKPCELLQ